MIEEKREENNSNSSKKSNLGLYIIVFGSMIAFIGTIVFEVMNK